jgi:hypothetical protein
MHESVKRDTPTEIVRACPLRKALLTVLDSLHTEALEIIGGGAKHDKTVI